MQGMISLICIGIALAVFMYISYKGLPPIISAPLLALFILFTSQLDVVEGMGGTYMTGVAGFFQSYFLTLCTGAIFGNMMADSGAARSIALKMSRVAKKFKGHEKLAAIWCIPLLSFVLSYAGVSVFVAFFTVIAIAKELFEEVDVPWRLYPVSCLGVAVMGLTMAPGSPSVNNAIAADILGTTAMAAPVLGVLACILALIGGQIYFMWELKRVEKRGEHFIDTGKEISKVQFVDPKAPFEEMNIVLALLPAVVLFVILNILGQKVYVASFIAIVVGFIIYWKRLSNKVETLNKGLIQSINATATVSIIVGMGTVIASTSGYQIVLDALNKVPGTGYLQVVIAVNIAAGFTSSSSGGLRIALESLHEHFINDLQLNPQVVHRIATISSGGLDSLPCNGTVLNELAQAKLKPSEAYFTQFILSVVLPIAVVLILCIFASFGIC